MERGIDVSENNGTIDWEEVAAEGISFAIIRLGYGRGHLDSMFYENYNGALAAGLKVGVYYYSYALDEAAAEAEARYMLEILRDAGIAPEDLAMGCWFDMEDADGYKARHGNPGDDVITEMCFQFILECNRQGYNCGVYASLDWLLNRIDTSVFADYVPIWCAEWGDSCSFDRATLWQETNQLVIGGQEFDGDYVL